jgi:hypothetical protein
VYKYSCLDIEAVRYREITLTAVQQDQIEIIRVWRNLQKNVLRQNRDIEFEEQEKYFNDFVWKYLDSSFPPQILFSVYSEGTFKAYGGLVHISWENMRGEVSFLADPSLGENTLIYGRIFHGFLEALEEIAKSQLGLHKLTLETYEFRKSHLSVIEQAGYTQEGVLLDQVLIDQQWSNSILHRKVFS